MRHVDPNPGLGGRDSGDTRFERGGRALGEYVRGREMLELETKLFRTRRYRDDFNLGRSLAFVRRFDQTVDELDSGDIQLWNKLGNGRKRETRRDETRARTGASSTDPRFCNLSGQSVVDGRSVAWTGKLSRNVSASFRRFLASLRFLTDVES